MKSADRILLANNQRSFSQGVIPCSGENPKKFFIVRQIGLGQVSDSFRVIATQGFSGFDVNGVYSVIFIFTGVDR